MAVDPYLCVQGTRVPRLGLGTWQLTGAEGAEAVRDALVQGYRHIDTARMYRNEREVGRGLRESGVPRDAVWVTTKVWHTEAAADRVRRSCEASLADLGLDRVDLLLLHWPARDVPVAETLGALAALREEGLAREIGVSNYPTALLREALEVAPVFADQVELHPHTDQTGVLRLARERDVMVTAYSPFAEGRVLRDPVLREIAGAHDAQPAQVVLRWLFSHPHVSAIPRSSSHERRASNLAALELELSPVELERISALAA